MPTDPDNFTYDADLFGGWPDDDGLWDAADDWWAGRTDREEAVQRYEDSLR